jgi:hypothetical protein
MMNLRKQQRRKARGEYTAQGTEYVEIIHPLRAGGGQEERVLYKYRRHTKKEGEGNT